MITIALSENIECNESQWVWMARQFGLLFVQVFAAEDVTTYIHVLVCIEHNTSDSHCVGVPCWILEGCAWIH